MTTETFQKSDRDRQYELEVEPAIQSSEVEISENHICIIAVLIVFSFIGALIRVYVQRGLTYIGEPVASIIYPQFIGSLIMGAAVQLKSKMELWSHTLFIGITVGLCGSITTFSGVIGGTAQQYFNAGDYDRKKIQSVIAGLSLILLGFGLAYVGFVMGRHLGKAFHRGKTPKKMKLAYATPVWFKRKQITKIDALFMLIAVLMIAAVICVSLLVHTERVVIFTLIFAPPGTLIRRWLSYLNKKYPKFPIGTFIANIFGAALYTILYLLPGAIYIDYYQCNIIGGLLDGFCGCLTTISTWIVEVSFMKTHNSYMYGGLSILVAEILNVIIFFAMGVPHPYVNKCL